MNDSQQTYLGLLWHAVFLSITVTFTEVNTVLPALVLDLGGNSFHVGLISAIMIGIPLISKLFFTSFLSQQRRKQPWLLVGIYLRVLSLVMIGITLSYQTRFSFFLVMLLVYGALLLFSLSGAFAGLPYIHIVGGSLEPGVRKRFFPQKQIIASVGTLVSVFAAQYILRRFPHPQSYVYLFFAAGSFLLIASAGFWALKEVPREPEGSKGYLETLKAIPSILRSDRSFFSYILFSNVMSISLALIPFFIGFARNRFSISEEQFSFILLVQISGMIVSSLIWPKVVASGGFKRILIIRIILNMLIPCAAILVGSFGTFPIYLVVVFLIGFSLSGRTVSEDAVLIELSDDANRVLYSGILGTLNISIIIFPIILGSLIELTGTLPVFISVGMVSAAGFFFLRRMTCPVDVHDSKAG